jgi:hypothetical protein
MGHNRRVRELQQAAATTSRRHLPLGEEADGDSAEGVSADGDLAEGGCADGDRTGDECSEGDLAEGDLAEGDFTDVDSSDSPDVACAEGTSAD